MTTPTCGQEVHKVGCSGESRVLQSQDMSQFSFVQTLIILRVSVFPVFSSGRGRGVWPRPGLDPPKSPSNPPDFCLQLSQDPGLPAEFSQWLQQVPRDSQLVCGHAGKTCSLVHSQGQGQGRSAGVRLWNTDGSSGSIGALK